MRWLIAISMSLALVGSPLHAAEPLTVFAAASLKNVLDEAATAYARQGGETVRASYAATSVLAKQIEQGAPADIFASADLEWMDYLDKRRLIKPQTRVDLLGNALVVIAPSRSALKDLKLDAKSVLDALGPDGKLATGEVNSVPVGKYARTALGNLRLWTDVEPRVAGVDNVRAALNFVARGEAALGIVYATDAAVEPNVRVVATFPENSHPAIIYPFAIVEGSRADGARFMAFLKSAEAGAIFAKAGFRLLGPPKQTN
ncbi:MAG: molybdate ABC transporter substrate-binding protein [Beijerinckiaceae bacterium]|nr:molybdate ABC transporter substrate-binding protein [Beijerinckiaceae bacterium]